LALAVALLITTGMANAAIDIDAARERGVVVCGTRAPASPAAELTWAPLARAPRRHDRGRRARRLRARAAARRACAAAAPNTVLAPHIGYVTTGTYEVVLATPSRTSLR
jgi:phosphoglycerate dehydrogenase-like enzyme